MKNLIRKTIVHGCMAFVYPVLCGTTRRRIPGDNQNGSVLVIALLILVFLTLIGISASTTTQIEIQIAGNERAYNVAFNTSDSGVHLSPKVVRRCFEDSAQPALANITCTPTSPGFFRKVMGFDPTPGGRVHFDLSLESRTFPVDVNVARLRAVNLGGGGVEFASGTEGVGVGAASGVAIIYGMDSTGKGPNNASSNVVAEYRLIPGLAGGL